MTRNIKADVYRTLTNEDAFGTALFVAVAHIIPIEEFSQMNLDAVILDLRDEVKVDLGETENLLRLQAAMAIVFEPGMFYEDVVGFIDICNALAREDIDPDVFDPADPLEMAWAVTEARILDEPQPNEPPRWSPEVKTYMGITLSHFGHLKPPPQLAMATMPAGFNPALQFADQPDLVATSTAVQDELNKEVVSAISQLKEELHEQLKPFVKPSEDR